MKLDEILNQPSPALKETLSEIPYKKIICSKCDGVGKIWIYNHVKRGKCFACNGRGFILKYGNGGVK